MAEALPYVASVVGVAWGIAHLLPTGKVVRGFGEIGRDNRLIITMEWVAEGVSLIFIGALVALVTARGGLADTVTHAVYAISAAMLLAMAVLTASTAARGSVPFFKLCPFVKSAMAVMLLVSIGL